VLINGAAGNVGPFAVQIAKSFGAEVTGVDSTTKLDMLRSIGADHVIDYTEEDYTKTGQRYDRILDVAAYRALRDEPWLAASYSCGGLSMPFDAESAE
jgi:NADPH:quinone reductase-like Zn-dependent oxidoreductase